MSRISEKAYNAARAIVEAYQSQLIDEWIAINQAFYGTSRAKDASSSNKPLASRKPAGSRAKGKPSKSSKQTRKMADKG